ncbi:MAG: alpha-L-fucosidase, partial [Candidatus Lokiarchaeota archaeon]|nr:alpha-L-fucosidase [Candidatus Lokiarchaeota archaeon]MBD3339488.1 alpha-L-fucosidase [Candidatus Lokiarchaeota archaeon]
LKKYRKSNMKYKPNKESVSQHEVPEWFQDAKLGIFIHWGLYSVPAFAVTGLDLTDSMKKGLDFYCKYNPYAEWYLNTLRISGSPTEKYHKETYGDNFSYDDFVPIFNEEIENWNPDEWIKLVKKSGARYVVITTKHCDGFLLWDSNYPNPYKKNYSAKRDIVGELSKSVKRSDLNIGFYYSTAWDWTFNKNPIKDAESFLENFVNPPEYTEYVNNHLYELIDKYQPKVLWADMGYPEGTDVYEIFAYFYNRVPEGVVNDRWKQYISAKKKFKKTNHNDFVTPEYKVFKKIKRHKWEICRGIGNSFGYNKFEEERDYLTTEELIHLLIDVVSKNGNLLLNIGPKADGSIPEIQRERLIGLGKWLNVNGEAIFGSRPWKSAEGLTNKGIPVRFTKKGEILFLILLEIPETKVLSIQNENFGEISEVYMLGKDESIKWKQEKKKLTIYIPKNLKETPAISFKIEFNPIEEF